MASCSLPLLESGDPRLKLTLQDRVRNVFVTQTDARHEREEKVKYIPVVKESSSRVLEAGVNTLQKTLLLKKKAELDQVDERLTRKRDEFKSRMEDLAHKRSELKLKQQQDKETRMRFEKFVADNEAKRSRALEKYEAAQEENASKQSQIEELTEELRHLRVRQQVLKEKIEKYKIYEDYLLKTLQYFPSTYLDHGSQPSVMSIIRRHEALSVTNQELRSRLGHAEEEVERGSQQLQSMRREHNVKKLMDIKELSELQGELDSLKEENEQMEEKLVMEHGLSREKAEEVGRLLTAISNLAEQCYVAARGPLQNMTVLLMMDMVKEYITDKSETEKRARRLMESEPAETSRAAPTDKKRERESLKKQQQMEAAILVSSKKDILSLFPERTSSSKEKELRSQFSHVRIIHGDGNCLYRALLFAHLESMIHNDRALQRFKRKITETCADFFIAGFEESSFMHHVDTVVDVAEQCQNEREEGLLHLFNEQKTSNSAVQYLRLLTSAHLQNNADFFCHFVEAPNFQLYCRQEVETMAMEGDHVEILALTQALDMSIHIVAMDGPQEHLAHHVIPEGSEPSLHFLHQSAHYNILYPRPKADQESNRWSQT